MENKHFMLAPDFSRVEKNARQQTPKVSTVFLWLSSVGSTHSPSTFSFYSLM
jgi:hypothetical protein